MNELTTQLLRTARLLLATAVLAMCACLFIFYQQLEINHLKHLENQQTTFDQSQEQFDQTVTDKLVAR